jgi:predicted metal-binding transcription factor (methanogenesis marker protein 9)
MFRIEHNVETGEIKQIELTAKEISDFEEMSKKDLLRVQTLIKENEAKANEKAALLAKLGITEDEARLLLG